MRYIAKRYIDHFQPGDNVTDAYDAETLTSLVYSGHVSAIAQPDAPISEPVEAPSAPKPKAKK